MILEANDHQVISAANGDQALAEMRRDKPDLVLLDVMMSCVLDGLEVTKEIQADSEPRDIPVIMISSIAASPHAGMFAIDEYLLIDHWISKPVQPENLLKTVKRCLPRRTSHRGGKHDGQGDSPGD